MNAYHGPIVGPMIRVLRQGDISAKQLDQEAGAIQSRCGDQCMQHIFDIQRHYEQAMTQLISATSEKLGQSYTGHSNTSGPHISLPPVESLNMQFSNFERARNILYGGMAGGTMVGLLSGVAISLLFPPAAAAVFIAEFAGVGGALDVHFISSLPVKPQPVCTAWVDKRPAQIVAAEG